MKGLPFATVFDFCSIRSVQMVSSSSLFYLFTSENSFVTAKSSRIGNCFSCLRGALGVSSAGCCLKCCSEWIEITYNT